MGDQSYFVYLVTEDCPSQDIWRGVVGVGSCSLSPGILDAPYGVMYVAPASFVNKFRTGTYPLTENQIKTGVLAYFTRPLKQTPQA